MHFFGDRVGVGELVGLVDWDWWIGGLKPTLQPTLRYKENTTKRYGSGNNGRVGFSPPLQTASAHCHSRAGGNPVCSVSVVFGFRVISKSSFPRRRESRPLGGGNIQKSSENSEVPDSRFCGNDEELRE